MKKKRQDDVLGADDTDLPTTESLSISLVLTWID